LASLLDELIEAHGGLARWAQLETMHARLTQGGVTWALKGYAGELSDVYVIARLHEQSVSHRPFLEPGLHSCYRPSRVSIERPDGTEVDSFEDPRVSFAGHTLQTPWSRLQLVYFVGTSMWTYLTHPFTYALPGFETKELGPWDEKGEELLRLQVTWPDLPVGHSRVQTLYFGEDRLIRRFDYEIDIMDGARGAHLVSDYTEVAGILVPRQHNIFARDEKDQLVPEPLLVPIGLDEIAFAQF
jgi:hypothetical protein